MRPSDGGKGDDRRPEDNERYRQNHDRVDWSKKVPPAPPKPQACSRWPFDVRRIDE
jgi:hypothetical protein